MNILINDQYRFALQADELENTHSQLSKLLELAAENQPLKRVGEDKEYGLHHFPKIIELENALDSILTKKLHQPTKTFTSKRTSFFSKRLFKSMFGFLGS